MLQTVVQLLQAGGIALHNIKVHINIVLCPRAKQDYSSSSIGSIVMQQGAKQACAWYPPATRVQQTLSTKVLNKT